jgi:subtilisin family serine protease
MPRSLLPLLAVAVVTACAGDPVQPTAARTTTANLAVGGGASRWVVDFNGPARGDFAARVAALGGSVDFVVERAGFAAVTGLSGQTAAALGRSPGINSVFEDVIVQAASPGLMGEMAAADVGLTSIANPAGSFRFAFQWNMRAIGANTAWAGGNLGAATVTAAILDTGLDYDGFDLNTMVDLARSVSFVTSDNALINTFFPGRHPIDDFNGHGTNVATQVSSNATLFAGVNSRARLIGVKVAGASGSGSLTGILAGIVWAADHGADVANLSLGVQGGVDKAGNGLFVGITNRVLNYAHRAGMVVVVSAGNEATNLDNNGRILEVFCEAPHVICVSATGPTASTNAFSGPWTNVDAGASYSNIGRKSITVSAPGGTTSGWVSSVCARHRAFTSGMTVVFVCNVPPGFFVTAGYAGTSQAAPHVTGVVAQMIAKYGKLPPSQMKQLLLNSLDDLGPPGPDDVYGAGRVNLAKALAQ